MCFHVYESFTKGPLIAEKDIVVYKGMHRTFMFFTLISPYQGSLYIPFITKRKIKLNLTGARYDSIDYQGKIEEGYHSCSTRERAWIHGSIVAKFIIPKDSTYYYDEERGEYVSDRIRLVNVLQQYKKNNEESKVL